MCTQVIYNNYKCCVYNYEESMHHLSVNMHNHNLYACIDNYMFIANYFHYTVITSCRPPQWTRTLRLQSCTIMSSTAPLETSFDMFL